MFGAVITNERFPPLGRESKELFFSKDQGRELGL